MRPREMATYYITRLNRETRNQKAAKHEIPQNLTLIAAGGHEETSPRTFPLVAAEWNCGHHGKSPGRRCAGGGGTGEAAAAAQWGRKARRRRRDSERGVRRVGAVNGLDRGHGHMNKGAGAQRTFRLALLTGCQRGLPPCPAT